MWLILNIIFLNTIYNKSETYKLPGFIAWASCGRPKLKKRAFFHGHRPQLRHIPAILTMWHVKCLPLSMIGFILCVPTYSVQLIYREQYRSITVMPYNSQSNHIASVVVLDVVLIKTLLRLDCWGHGSKSRQRHIMIFSLFFFLWWIFILILYQNYLLQLLWRW